MSETATEIETDEQATPNEEDYFEVAPAVSRLIPDGTTDGDLRPTTTTDASIVGELVRVAGRPWAMRAEAIEYLASAIRAGICAPRMLAVVEPPAEVPAAQNGVAVIPLSGVITPHGGGMLGMLLGMGGGLAEFTAQLAAAATAPEVKQIVLDVDSPGGLIDQVPETAAVMAAVRERKPITAVASTQMASAAYWIGAQASELVVTPSGEVGSVGVYMMHVDESSALESHGINVTLTSAGRYKTEGNPYEPLDSAGAKARQRKVDEIYEMFVADVASGRRADQGAVRNGYGEGRALLAEDAVSAGLCRPGGDAARGGGRSRDSRGRRCGQRGVPGGVGRTASEVSVTSLGEVSDAPADFDS